MSSRSSTDDERHFALWSGKQARMPVGSPRVLIAHQDKLIGESLAALLRLTGLQVMQTQNLKSARSLLQNWKPQALILDTRLDSDSGYEFIRALRPDADTTGRLLVAISNIWPADPVESLKHARALLARLRYKSACAAPDAFQHRIAVVLSGQHDGLYLALLFPDPVQQIEARGVPPQLIVEKDEIVRAAGELLLGLFDAVGLIDIE